MIARGSHINAIGAIVPARSEFAQDVFPRCDKIVVDSIRSVRELSAEFREHFGDDGNAWNTVQPISEVIAHDSMRPANSDLTLFKAMGMGTSDLALAVEILDRARAENKGHPLPDRVRTPPRLTG